MFGKPKEITIKPKTILRARRSLMNKISDIEIERFKLEYQRNFIETIKYKAEINENESVEENLKYLH